MKRRLFLAALLAIAVGSSVAWAQGPPEWPEFPSACMAEHGVCFHEFEGVHRLFAADASTGDLAIAYINAGINDFMRQDPDGSNFIHFIDQEFEGVYCPYGEACWPIVDPGRISYAGFVNLDPGTGAFSPACPASATARATVESPTGGLFTLHFFGVWIPTPQGDCEVHKLEIRLRPAQ